MGRVDYLKNDNDAAISESQIALNFYKPAGYRRETSLALTLLGRAYQDKGEDATALKFFQEQSELVKQAGDESGIADAHMNLALLLGFNQEKFTEALAHLEEKLKLDEAHHSERLMASDQMNRAIFFAQLGRYDEARAALQCLGTVPGQTGLRLMRFEFVLLQEFGYSPSLAACAGCGAA